MEKIFVFANYNAVIHAGVRPYFPVSRLLELRVCDMHHVMAYCLQESDERRWKLDCRPRNFMSSATHGSPFGEPRIQWRQGCHPAQEQDSPPGFRQTRPPRCVIPGRPQHALAGPECTDVPRTS